VLNLDHLSATDSVARTYLENLSQVLALVSADALDSAIDLLLEARANRRRVYIVGNGGSAATASHLACDLVKTAQVPGMAPLRAFALADNTALMTAWANDVSFNRTFAEQVLAIADADDVVLLISASGNSKNILDALEAARSVGAKTLALVGFDGGAAALMADFVVHVPCNDYGLVEDTHAAIGHAMTAAIRAALTSAVRD
jgi:D-sedoheptulose 7-phosphate isomerase